MIYFNAYDAVDVKDSAKYWEVTALPEGCNTPDGYIRVRFEEDGDGGAGGGEDGGVEGLALGMIGNLACLGKVESPN